MSYGNVYIADDLERGLSVYQVAKKIHARYSDITLPRALEMAKDVKRYGPDVHINWAQNTTKAEDKVTRILNKFK